MSISDRAKFLEEEKEKKIEEMTQKL